MSEDMHYKKIEKLFVSVDSYFTDESKDVKQAIDLEITAKTKKLINELKKIEKKEAGERFLFKIGILLLLIGICGLFLDDVKLHLIFLARWIMVLVKIPFKISPKRNNLLY